jgi:ubiquinol-cytochrome c reductase cytochrome b/c1 subunit
LATFYYFAFFLLVMPIVGLIERPKKLPGSITQSVLGPEPPRESEPPRTSREPVGEGVA